MLCRFSAQYREYRYFIPYNEGEMDLVSMQQAANAFLGQHDFRNFCKVDAEHIKHCVRCILDFRIGEYPGFSIDGKNIAQVHIRGSAFLWHQVKLLCILKIWFILTAMSLLYSTESPVGFSAFPHNIAFCQLDFCTEDLIF